MANNIGEQKWFDVGGLARCILTDDSLVHCLFEVRRALGDDSQRFIKTVPRRGYIFEAVVGGSVSGAVKGVPQNGLKAPNFRIEENEFKSQAHPEATSHLSGQMSRIPR